MKWIPYKFNPKKLSGKRVKFKKLEIPEFGKPYFKEFNGYYIKIGFSYEEFEMGAVQYSTGIIIDENGKFQNIPIENITFVNMEK
jgi:hypothetical protein